MEKDCGHHPGLEDHLKMVPTLAEGQTWSFLLIQRDQDAGVAEESRWVRKPGPNRPAQERSAIACWPQESLHNLRSDAEHQETPADDHQRAWIRNLPEVLFNIFFCPYLEFKKTYLFSIFFAPSLRKKHFFQYFLPLPWVKNKTHFFSTFKKKMPPPWVKNKAHIFLNRNMVI